MKLWGFIRSEKNKSSIQLGNNSVDDDGFVFISYSSKDEKEAMRLCKKLENRGVKCWISGRDLDRSKSNWQEELLRRSTMSSKILLLATENSLASGQVLNEISNASSKSKEIIPYFPRKTYIPLDILYYIQKYESIEVWKGYRDKDMVDILIDRLRSQETNNKIKKFRQTISSDDYKNFVYAVMRLYYGDEFFSTINSISFPVYIVDGIDLQAEKSITEFAGLSDYEHSDLSFNIDNHRSYKEYPYFEEYSILLEGSIKAPDRPGYMLDKLNLNKNGKIESVCVHVATYAENVYSNHVLEYEMYLAYQNMLKRGLKVKDIERKDVWEEFKKVFLVRNIIHGEIGNPGDINFFTNMKKSLCRGCNRHSLLSVQMLVIVKSAKTHEYELKIAERADKVAIKQRVYQFIPAGGFEILNDSDDNIYDDSEIYLNFSAGCAVFREYLEEVFNEREFDGAGTGNIEERLLKDRHIIEIESLIKNKKAVLRFLGSAIGLDGLRQELSFVLVIKDESYSNRQFIANDECKKGRILEGITVKNFENNEKIWRNIHEPSAALWQMFKTTDLYRKIVTDDMT